MLLTDELARQKTRCQRGCGTAGSAGHDGTVFGATFRSWPIIVGICSAHRARFSASVTILRPCCEPFARASSNWLFYGQAPAVF